MNVTRGMLVIAAVKSVVLCALLFSPMIVQAKYVALVIGNQAYPDAPLSNPVNDADAIARAFENMGYDEVRVVKNADTRTFDTALDEFTATAAAAYVAVIYYAGHGMQIDGKNYLMPVDLKVNSSRDIRELITQRELVDEVARAKRFGLVILDACRDNPFANQVATTLSRSFSTRGLAREESASGSNTLVAYATASDDIAADGQGLNSPYTKALLNHVNNPEFDVYQLFGTVRDTVVLNTGGQQTPYHYGSTGGQRYFLHPKGYLTATRPDDSIADVTTPIVNEDFTIAVSRIQSFKDDLVNKDWGRLLDSRSLSADAVERVNRWRDASEEINVTMGYPRASQSTQSVYSDLVISGADVQPETFTVQVVRKADGNWSPINW